MSREIVLSPDEVRPPLPKTNGYGKRTQKLPHLDNHGDYISVSLGARQATQQLAWSSPLALLSTTGL